MDFQIDYLALILGYECNFKCISCSNFCPKAIPKTRHYNSRDIIKNLDIVLKYIYKIDVLQIQGGEPLLNLEFLNGGGLDYIGNQIENGKIRHAFIATNGSIVPSKETLSIIHNNHIAVRISDYGLTPTITKKLEEECQSFGIRYQTYEFASHSKMWFDCGEINTKREDNDSIVSKRYKDCYFKDCYTMELDEISRCARAANSFRLQEFERDDSDYLKIVDNRELPKDIEYYFSHGKPMQACRYCKGTYQLINPAIQEGKK